MSEYFLVLTNIGIEKLLKEEVARFSASYRFAFSRPGFVTFKDSEDKLNLDHLKSDWVWGRQTALSFGKKTVEELKELLKEVPAQAKISVCSRDPEISLDRELSDVGIVSRSGSSDQEYLVIQVDPGVYYYGLRKRSPSDFDLPGGRMFPAEEVEAKSEAIPSRAYYKLREAMHLTGAELKAGDKVVEVGCAPGGASLALLEKGAEVWGIDPGQMDPMILENPRFHSVRKPMSFVVRSEVVEKPRWWIVDMNVAPQAVLSVIEPWIRQKPSIERLFLTLKMNEMAFAAELPKFAQRVKTWGFSSVIIRQLPSNKQEVCLMAYRKV